MTKVYVTKYALTEGPFEVDAVIGCEGRIATWVVERSYQNHAHGKDFWLTPEEALADCERRREAKLKSIEKQAKKLQSMQFEIKKP